MYKKFLEKTAKNVDRLTHLLNDLDEISKLERGELVLYKQNFVIQELVKDVFESLSGKAEEMNIHGSIKKGCESPLTVFADKEKIRQVLTNLVENSIRPIASGRKNYLFAGSHQSAQNATLQVVF